MNWLSKDMQELLEQAILQSEQLVENAIRMIDQTLVNVEQSLDDVLEPVVIEIEQGLDHFLEPVVIEIEQGLDHFLEPVVMDLVAFEQVLEELAYPLTQRLYPLFDQHPACIGCSHYHGKTYGDTFLVCGMHPYGAPSESCPDWESC